MGSVVKGVTGAVKGVIGGIGKGLGIGGGNTPRLDVGKYKHNLNASAFGPTNADIEQDLRVANTQAQNNVAGVDQLASRARQTTLADALDAQMRGEGPSLAQNQLKQGTERNLAQQLALAASSRGGNAATTQRELMRNQAATNQQAVQQSADTRMMEQMNAQQLLGGLSTQMREQDANAQNNAMGQQFQSLGEIMAIRDANRAAGINFETNKMNQGLGLAGVAAGDVASRRQANSAAVGGLAQGVGAGLIALSDERQKTDIKDGSVDIINFLDALDAKKFSYKEPDKFGKGERVGVMAQDVEKAGPMGSEMVHDTEIGKVLDLNKGFGAVLAAQAELHQRLKDLEGKKGKKRA